jgi:hypothetical protein
MESPTREKRSENRTCFEPLETGHTLEGIIEGQSYTFTVLNICRGGIGILVRGDQAGVMENLQPGTRFRMNYVNPKGSLAVTVEIRHRSPISSGPFTGFHSVGFSLSV